MSESWRARAAVIGLIIAGCGGDRAPEDPSIAGRVVGQLSDGHAPLRVAYGKRWVHGGDVVADATGAFRVPATARAVVAYVDTNHNERFDRYAEPSGDCELVAHGWTCSLVAQRTTVHRSISRRNAEEGDQTLIFWEDFNADGARVETSQLCVESRCTDREMGPFVSRAPAQVRMFSLCGEEGFPDQQAAIRGAAQASVVPISHPKSLDVSIRGEPLEQHGNELHLEVRSAPLDRLLVWAGTVRDDSRDVSHVYWSSETDDIVVTDHPERVDVRIPSALVRTCQQDPACEIVIQVLKYWSAPGARVVAATEYRSTVSFRGQL